MALTVDKVRHIAHLARLRLTDEEVKRFQGQLSSILSHIAQLNELDTSEVPPTAHPLPVQNVFRPDEPRDSIPVESALANAPKSQSGFFVVPKVLEQE